MTDFRRVLFVAMSGVRVVDPQLRALGLSLPGFIERGRTIASLPSLGLLTLAAHTPTDDEVRRRRGKFKECLRTSAQSTSFR